jgi:hypothetical protein
MNYNFPIRNLLNRANKIFFPNNDNGYCQFEINPVSCSNNLEGDVWQFGIGIFDNENNRLKFSKVDLFTESVSVLAAINYLHECLDKMEYPCKQEQKLKLNLQEILPEITVESIYNGNISHQLISILELIKISHKQIIIYDGSIFEPVIEELTRRGFSVRKIEKSIDKYIIRI